MIPTEAELLTIAEARSWRGTRWAHQGRLKGVAADCAGLIEGVGKARGYVPQDLRLTQYSPQPDPIKMKAALRAYLVPIYKGPIRPASVIWMRVVDDVGQHLGILTERNSLIHASNNEFVTEIPIETLMRREKFLAAYRYRGIDNG